MKSRGFQKNVAFRHGVQCVNDLAVQKLEIGRRGHVDPGCLADNAIEGVCGKAAQTGFFTPVMLDALHHFIALLPQAVHLNNFLRRMLQVAVQHHAAVSAGLFKPRKHGGFFTKIAAEADAADTGIFFPGAADFIPGAVLRTIIDK